MRPQISGYHTNKNLIQEFLNEFCLTFSKDINGKEELFCSVKPWLIAKNFGLSNVSGVINAVQIESSLAGSVMITGAGAGGEPTASAVLADIVDIANGTKLFSFGRNSYDIKVNFKTT